MPPFDRLRPRGAQRPRRCRADLARVASGEDERDQRESGAADHQAHGADRERRRVVRSERHRRAGRAEQQRSGEDGEDVEHPPVLQAPRRPERTGRERLSRPGSARAPPVGWCGDTRYIAREALRHQSAGAARLRAARPLERDGVRLRADRAVRPAHRAPPRCAELRHPAPLADPPVRPRHVRAQRHRHRRQGAGERRPSPSRGGRWRTGWSSRSRARMPRSASRRRPTSRARRRPSRRCRSSSSA